MEIINPKETYLIQLLASEKAGLKENWNLALTVEGVVSGCTAYYYGRNH